LADGALLGVIASVRQELERINTLATGAPAGGDHPFASLAPSPSTIQ
jgi:hypothetical protein